jgi:DNA-binding transcriptional MerR regulator
VARSGGQRIYDHEDAHRLAFIRRCRDFDFSIPEVRSLLSLMQDGTPCGEARKLAEGHLGELRKKLNELQALERTIASLVTASASTCDGGTTADCVIVQPQ